MNDKSDNRDSGLLTLLRGNVEAARLVCADVLPALRGVIASVEFLEAELGRALVKMDGANEGKRATKALARESIREAPR